MFQKAIRELRGDEVLARDGRIGTVDDIYFDGESWQGRYLAVATAGGDPRPARWLISVACVAAGARVLDRVHMELSCAQLEYGGGAWPIETASRWLDGERVCSSRKMVGFHVEAQDGIAGRVADLIVDDEAWSIDYMLVDPEQAAGGKQVLLPLDWVGGIDLERGAVRVRRTREELRSSPRV